MDNQIKFANISQIILCRVRNVISFFQIELNFCPELWWQNEQIRHNAYVLFTHLKTLPGFLQNAELVFTVINFILLCCFLQE